MPMRACVRNRADIKCLASHECQHFRFSAPGHSDARYIVLKLTRGRQCRSLLSTPHARVFDSYVQRYYTSYCEVRRHIIIIIIIMAHLLICPAPFQHRSKKKGQSSSSLYLAFNTEVCVSYLMSQCVHVSVYDIVYFVFW